MHSKEGIWSKKIGLIFKDFELNIFSLIIFAESILNEQCWKVLDPTHFQQLFYGSCPFRSWVIMPLPNFLCFVALFFPLHILPPINSSGSCLSTHPVLLHPIHPVSLRSKPSFFNKRRRILNSVFLDLSMSEYFVYIFFWWERDSWEDEDSGSTLSYVYLKVEQIIIQWTNDCNIFFFKTGKPSVGKSQCLSANPREKQMAVEEGKQI